MLVSDLMQILQQTAVGDVLILVLVDVGLGPEPLYSTTTVTSLNPCFSGCWSRTVHGGWKRERTDVLILVLVDVGLGR